MLEPLLLYKQQAGFVVSPKKCDKSFSSRLVDLLYSPFSHAKRLSQFCLQKVGS